jgi:hypothetical protein
LNEGYAVLVGNTVAFHALKPRSSMMPYVIHVSQAELSIQRSVGDQRVRLGNFFDVEDQLCSDS